SAKTAATMRSTTHLKDEMRVLTRQENEDMLDPVTNSMKKFGRGTMLSAALAMVTFTGTVLLTGCPEQSVAAQQQTDNGPDPADANMAPVDGSQPDTAQAPPDQQDQSQQQGQLQPSTGGAPVYRAAPPQNEAQQQADQYGQNQQDQSQPPRRTMVSTATRTATTPTTPPTT